MCEKEINLELLDEEGKSFAKASINEETRNKLLEIGLLKVLSDHVGENKNTIETVVFDYPYTNVTFKDGSSEAVAPWGDDEFSPELGVMWAVVKNMFGSVSKFQKFVDKWAKDWYLQEQIKEAQREFVSSENFLEFDDFQNWWNNLVKPKVNKGK